MYILMDAGQKYVYIRCIQVLTCSIYDQLIPYPLSRMLLKVKISLVLSIYLSAVHTCLCIATKLHSIIGSMPTGISV